MPEQTLKLDDYPLSTAGNCLTQQLYKSDVSTMQLYICACVNLSASLCYIYRSPWWWRNI